MSQKSKKYLPLYIAGIIIIAGGLTYFAVHVLASNYLTSNASADKTVTCHGRHPAHSVVVKNDAMVPEHTTGGLCDTLTIKNEDKSLKLIAFGPHDHHQPYDGVTEVSLSQNQSFTITFNKLGTYHFHDHIGDIAQGDFTVHQ